LPKIVISNPKIGRSYQMEFDKSKMGELVGRRVGEEVDGGFLGLPGYKLRLTGGTDKQGFPMRRGIHRAGRAAPLLAGGAGLGSGRRDVRRRKTVVGEILSDEIEQLNMTVLQEGKTPLESILKKEGA